MASDTYIFKRIEKKYLIREEDCEQLLARISEHLYPDPHGKSTICSLYLDTPSFLLIRNSIDARTYKEKIRLRSYGTPGEQDRVFLELKKKYKGVVYKRRIVLPLGEAMDYILHGNKPPDSQILREIDYAMHFYNEPKPAMMIVYERDAFFFREYPALRITFDRNVRYRNEELRLEAGTRGKHLLDADRIIMEIKTDGAMPLFLSSALDELKIFPSSFSKYGRAYLDILSESHSPTPVKI